MNIPLLLVAFPTADDEPLYWWRVDDGVVQARGCDSDPWTASHAAGQDDAPSDVYIVAIVPSHLTTIIGHDAVNDVTDSQGLAAAIMAAKAQSLD
ncbi:MAG: hypothetical protein ABJ082_05430, partial [Parasphingorhabdus sp.]